MSLISDRVNARLLEGVALRRTILFSHMINATSQKYCLRIRYMNDAKDPTGGIAIYITELEYPVSGNFLWKTQTSGQLFTDVVNVTLGKDWKSFRLLFEANINSVESQGVALTDVKLTEGPCSTPTPVNNYSKNIL